MFSNRPAPRRTRASVLHHGSITGLRGPRGGYFFSSKGTSSTGRDFASGKS
jgi:hypothetical protein